MHVISIEACHFAYFLPFSFDGILQATAAIDLRLGRANCVSSLPCATHAVPGNVAGMTTMNFVVKRFRLC